MASTFCKRCGREVTMTVTRRGGVRVHAHNKLDGSPCRVPNPYGHPRTDEKKPDPECPACGLPLSDKVHRGFGPCL